MSGFHPKDLIREVKCRPAIYDRDLQVPPRRDHKHQLWLEVAEILTPAEDWEQYTDVEKDARIDEIQTKWKHLKDHFHREIKLHEAGQSHKKRKYVYFDDMEFMRPFVGYKLPPVNKRKKMDSIDSMEESMDAGNVTDFDMDSLLKSNNTVEEYEINDVSAMETPRQQRVAKRAFKTAPKAGKGPAIKNFEFIKKSSSSGSSGSFQIRDGDISFCLSLVPTLRKMGDSKKLRAKIEILKVLHRHVLDAERNRLGKRSNTSYQNNEDDDDPDFTGDDHLEDDEGINIKHENHNDPLHGDRNTNKTWWT